MAALDGKVAIVTGAGAGLGRAHAHYLASQGAKVVVNDVRGAEIVVTEIVASGGEAVANEAGVSDWDASRALVQQAIDTYGDLHILVNNAGILRDKMSFNMDEGEWDAVVDVHLKGHFCPSRHAGSYWRAKAKDGATVGRRIINTTSEAGLFGSAGQANYAAAKAGIVGLTWVFAREYEKAGVTANAIAPRARTAMTEAMPMFGKPDEGFDPYDPDNVSRVVGWLASDGAADVSGQVFIVAGGGVHLVAPYQVAGSLRRERAWTIEELEAGKDELFGARPRGVPAFGGPAF